MKPLHTFTVMPSLPEPLEPLLRLAYDLHWAWSHDAIELFRRLDYDLWVEKGHNPVMLLGSVSQERLHELATDTAFLAHLDRVVRDFDEYSGSKTTWFRRTHGEVATPLVAYFSAEFGLTECLSIFAGGLGVLAGDHVKSASDLGVPLVGVGLLYQQGYFRQALNETGWQQELYEENDFANLPIQEVLVDGSPLVVDVPMEDGVVSAKVWVVTVGRVPLYLLDTNLSVNPPDNRDITDQLYGGDDHNRLRQEIVLGIGGFRALAALGHTPAVYHMNEGHSAFLVLEWIRRLMQDEGLNFAEAREAAAGLVFTTHTPVAAGHDYFGPHLVERYLGPFAAAIGVGLPELLSLGRTDQHDTAEQFCATVLALRTSSHINGVSRLHGSVSREMWQRVWPGVPPAEVPITSITNGVHFESWVSHDLKELYERYLGPKWREEPADHLVWARALQIAPEELWRTHERRRERLVAYARRSLRRQLTLRGAPQSEVAMADVVLDPEALTIGFARRFATYKRAGLLLRDRERLVRILGNQERPVQVIFAGKAHPRDDAGKELIRQIITLTRDPAIRRRLVFIQDYDMAVARYLVQGADVWLNTPVRPQEASGTSGMKAAANGVLNMSTLDGWWDEAHEAGLGWAIGRGETYADPEYRDQFEADALYDLLERDLVPAFYDRGVDGLPRLWLSMVQASLAKLNAVYNAHRMVKEYTELFYLPVAARYRHMAEEGWKAARELAAWKQRIAATWGDVRLGEATVDHGVDTLRVGQPFDVEVKVHLGRLAPTDVAVELYLGKVGAGGEIRDGRTVPMGPVSGGDGDYVFGATNVSYHHSGTHGITVRAIPAHPDLMPHLIPGLITWA